MRVPLGCAPPQVLPRARWLLGAKLRGASWCATRRLGRPNVPYSSEAGRYRMWVGAPRAKDCWSNRTGIRSAKRLSAHPLREKFRARTRKSRNAPQPPLTRWSVTWGDAAPVRFRFGYFTCALCLLSDGWAVAD